MGEGLPTPSDAVPVEGGPGTRRIGSVRHGQDVQDSMEIAQEKKKVRHHLVACVLPFDPSAVKERTCHKIALKRRTLNKLQLFQLLLFSVG